MLHFGGVIPTYKDGFKTVSREEKFLCNNADSISHPETFELLRIAGHQANHITKEMIHWNGLVASCSSKLMESSYAQVKLRASHTHSMWFP